MRRFIAFGPAFVVLIASLTTLLAVPEAVRRIGYANTEVTIRLARAQLDHSDVLERLNASVRSIAKAVEPSVVHIAVESPVLQSVGTQRISQGSGWVYDGHGHVVTNAHVVRGMGVRGEPQITVQFYDGRTTRAEVIGVDPAYDIAVLRTVTTEGLFPARRATDVEILQGDRVYAFGSPFGFKFSMSEGIVSGLGRSPSAVVAEGGYTNFIQTDAAVNPGNSGGPLVDIYGKVLGMNVAIATGASPSGATEGQSSGISFAIPLDTIESVVAQLIAGGTVARGYIGITLPGRASQSPDELEELNRELMESTGYHGRGAYVERVGKDTPAETAGLMSADIITQINDKPVAGVAALRQLISINRPGDTVPVRVWRNGEVKDLKVILADLAASAVSLTNAGQAFVSFGITNFREVDAGLLITEVGPGTLADAAGVQEGMIITQLDGEPVSGWTAFRSILAERGFASGTPVEAGVTLKSGERRMIELRFQVR